MFSDRRDAGRQLADRLADYATLDPVVVGMARGGVPVAAVVADRLAGSFDVIVVRKIGVPWQPELGVGAIAEGGVVVVNDGLVAELGLGRKDLAAVIGRERRVLHDRVRRYRAGRPPVPVAGRLTILVDDGLATGFTARAAIEALRRRGAGKLVLAVPVAPPTTVDALRLVADEVIAVETPSWFFAIGDYYEDFSETSDDEIASLLADERSRIAGRRVRPQEVTHDPAAAGQAPHRRRSGRGSARHDGRADRRGVGSGGIRAARGRLDPRA